jgi:hypothetical protein
VTFKNGLIWALILTATILVLPPTVVAAQDTGPPGWQTLDRVDYLNYVQNVQIAAPAPADWPSTSLATGIVNNNMTGAGYKAFVATQEVTATARSGT